MLIYGLKPAFEELADDLMERNLSTSIVVDVQVSDARHSATIEQHLYRIVQEACANALRHGQARQVIIAGTINPESINLEIKDNGIGFDQKEGFKLDGLLTNKHFGLANMIERGRLIDATVNIQSTQYLGTHIQIRWISKSG